MILREGVAWMPKNTKTPITAGPELSVTGGNEVQRLCELFRPGRRV